MSAMYLTVSEVSEYLKLPEETVYKYARTGRMPASKVGRYWRFEQSKIDAWVNQNSNQGKNPLKVMLVDDDPQIRSMLTKWLIEAGCDVLTLTGGSEAIRMVGEQDCDLMLLDLFMPAPNGAETLAAIRKIKPELEVVLVTAYFESELMEQALEHGALTILKKPVEKEALEALLAGHAARVR